MAKIDSVFNECIERLRTGETVEQCLARYPENASELELLLHTVVSLKEVSSLQPRPEFRARAKAEVLLAVRNRMMSQKHRSHSRFSWHRTWVPVAASAFTLMVAGSGTIVASADALPGQPLYSVKRTVERAQVAVMPSEVGKAKLLAGYTDRRVKEMGDMVEAGRGDDIEQVSASMVNDLGRIKSTIGSTRNLEKAAGQADTKSQAEKQRQEDPVPPSAAPKIAALAQSTPSIAALSGSSRPEQASKVEKADDEKIEMSHARSPEEVRKALRQSGERQKRYLEELLEKASAKDKPAIRAAIDKIGRAYEDAGRSEKD